LRLLGPRSGAPPDARPPRQASKHIDKTKMSEDAFTQATTYLNNSHTFSNAIYSATGALAEVGPEQRRLPPDAAGGRHRLHARRGLAQDEGRPAREGVGRRDRAISGRPRTDPSSASAQTSNGQDPAVTWVNFLGHGDSSERATFG